MDEKKLSELVYLSSVCNSFIDKVCKGKDIQLNDKIDLYLLLLMQEIQENNKDKSEQNLDYMYRTLNDFFGRNDINLYVTKYNKLSKKSIN